MDENPMKLMYCVPSTKRTFERENGFHSAGIDLRMFFLDAFVDRRKVLIHNFSTFLPDVIFFNNRALRPSLLAELKMIKPDCKVFMFCGDIARHTFLDIVNYSEAVDVLLLSNSDKRVWNFFSKGGFKRIAEHQCATDPDVFRTEDRKPLYDAVLFANRVVRTKDYDFRNNLIGNFSFRSDLRFGLFGNGWGEGIKRSYGPDHLGVLSASRTQIVINGFGFLHKCFSNRTWNALAAGRLVLHYRTSGLEDYFTDGIHLRTFSSIKECEDLIKYYRDHEDEAKRIAHNGREATIRKHTYYHRAVDLTRLYKEMENETDSVVSA